jgi:hypothetical protein
VGGHDHHRLLRIVGLDFDEYVSSRESRQHYVQQNQIMVALAPQLQTLNAVIRHFDIKGGGQHPLNQIGGVRLIFYHQQTWPVNLRLRRFQQ